MNRLDELLKIVPDAPNFTIDWETVGRTVMRRFASSMKETPQNPRYHAEGNVWIHTVMVCEALVSNPEYRALETRKRQMLFLAALFHDVGKITTTRLRDGAWTSPNHAQAGANLIRDYLWRRYSLCGDRELQRFRETICLLVRYHMMPPYVLQSDNPEHRLIKMASNGELVPDFTLGSLLMLCRADSDGRITRTIQNGEDDAFFNTELSKELGCYDKPFAFPSVLTEFAYFSGRKVAPQAVLYDDTELEVTILCGLPGTGKDTWINTHYSDLPIVSLDEIRRQYHLAPTGSQQEVARIAGAQAKQLLREKRSFVWNATNITADLRSRLVSLFVRYRAYVRIVFLETEWEENKRRNAGRRDAVPENVIETMLSRLTPPERFEAHEVCWQCI